MRYATPNRSAHRATPALDLMFLVRSLPRPSAGQHRQHTRTQAAPRRHAWREPYPAIQLFTRGLAALIVLGIFLTLGFLVVADDHQDPVTPAGRVPLTVPDAFPAGAAGYRVERAVAEADCTLAVTGDLRSALSAYGCSQAVRANLTVPDGDYQVTAGILDLADAQSAVAVADRVRQLVETGDGSFTSMTGTPTAAGTPIGWRARGHYLIYCAIAGPGGEPALGEDPQLQEITAHLLDTYLSDQVLAHRP
ncbi:hypothetical protein GCM10010168_11320 [Actinoplanes ianthinogenes]|uniref:DUF3558 domain-containing protein n=1 Tax=Actinoplanes ianthinogenes TaxID=122358 RepID=A0ABN6CIF1_9ACTN|nr:hypothetical protein [Actinoplanes ianthinogenes]BCJ44319.1 hypothetical protein Aiant_49760 [Actinoplanes ianthinogenes]GGQ97238.1 hypothetical protein GCM10010168_11320 [Actinoplanes ianthinogenes]